jgi:hypothetical protein
MSNCTASQTQAQMLSLGGQPILENCIVTLTPPDSLSDVRFSHFLNFIIENKSILLTSKMTPSEMGIWKLVSVRLSNAGGFDSPNPARGLKHVVVQDCLHRLLVSTHPTPQGD